MIPLMLLLIYCASLFVSGTEIEQLMDHLLQSYVPDLPSGKNVIPTTIRRLTDIRGVVGIVGFGGLLWGSIGGFISLQKTLDTLSGIRHRRSFMKQYIVGFAMLGILLGLILLSSILMIVSPGFIAHIGLIRLTHWAFVGNWVGRISFAVILFVTCYFCYRYLPSKIISNLSLLIGAAVATCVIYFTRALFAIYTHHLGHYAMIYGALTYMMLLTFWIYIVSMIFLFGMEVALSVHNTWFTTHSADTPTKSASTS